ncbi:MASE1 protein [Collimonas sp. OK307]|uniref:MASE1 domain-containing protein n=1 Tax=Collimonas sp. OK307 TaxID=1801620 RepID=UPI0008E6CE76|nr:MASE1 domain-containing protein [Collimonas sp. OK307]SFH84247.1 MASE1 protein [Collimonas sp. OK307]
MTTTPSPVEKLRLNLLTISATAIVYMLVYMANDWLFKHIEFTQGIAWIYLPAGIRLICTLLFAEAGVLGILIGSVLTSSLYNLFPGDPVSTIGYSIISALAPYLAYRFTLQEMRLQRSLSNLTTTRLLACILLYGLANPLLQLVWFVLRGISYHFWSGLIVMSIGDLTGSLIVVYAIKILLSFVPLPRH